MGRMGIKKENREFICNLTLYFSKVFREVQNLGFAFYFFFFFSEIAVIWQCTSSLYFCQNLISFHFNICLFSGNTSLQKTRDVQMQSSQVLMNASCETLL